MAINKVNSPQKSKVILGIDPGTAEMGYGVIEITNNTFKCLQFGIIHLRKYDDHYLKLKKIFERVISIIDDYHPDEMALEAPFYGKNVQSMLKLGRAQGVAMSAALSREIPITEYAPLKVKQSVTGRGKASKEQVSDMVMRLLKIQEAPALFDATDALAVAICHHYQSTSLIPSGSSSWKAFIRENPDKVKK